MLSPNRVRALCLLAFLVLLAPYLLMAFYAYPAGDDFGYANVANGKGFIGGVMSYYSTWSGRFTAHLWQVGVPLLGDLATVYPWVLLLLLVLEFLAIWCFLSALLQRRPLAPAALLPALGFLLMYWTHVPNLQQAHYWLASTATYTFGSSCILVTLGLLLLWREELRWRWALAAAAALLGVLACGCNEMLALTLNALLGSIGAVLLWRRDPRWRAVAVVLVAAVLATLAVRLAPGNSARIGNAALVHSLDLGFAWRTTWDLVPPVLLNWVLAPMNLPALLLLLPALWHLSGQSPVLRGARYWHALALALGGLAWIVAMVGLCVFMLGQFVPSRIFNPLYLLFLFGGIAVMTVALAAYRNRDGQRPTLSAPVQVLAVLIFGVGVTLDPNGTWRTAVRELQQDAPQFRQEQTERASMIAAQIAAGERNVVVYELSVRPRCLFYIDLRANPSLNPNNQIASYYQVDSIRAIPKGEVGGVSP